MERLSQMTKPMCFLNCKQRFDFLLFPLKPLICCIDSTALHSRFCSSQLWLRQSLPLGSFPKALDEKQFVVPGEAFLCHESRRSLSDLQETSQWLGGCQVSQRLLEALTGAFFCQILGWVGQSGFQGFATRFLTVFVFLSCWNACR